MFKVNSKPQSAEFIDNSIPCGFQMTFENGNTISVQFGWGNYCSNRSESRPKSTTAEVAIWNSAGDWWQFEGDTVKGYCTADEVADYIILAKNTIF